MQNRGGGGMPKQRIDYKATGKRIMLCRKSRALTQDTLAHVAGITEQYLCKIERGNAQFSLNCLVNIANALYTTPDNLLMDNVPQAIPPRIEEVKEFFKDCSAKEFDIIMRTAETLKRTMRELKVTEKKIPPYD
jgi:transcriptional regulator with XRE-family HTH domain